MYFSLDVKAFNNLEDEHQLDNNNNFDKNSKKYSGNGNVITEDMINFRDLRGLILKEKPSEKDAFKFYSTNENE